MKWRAESFGALVQVDDPPALLWVDQDMARELGIDEQPTWQSGSDRLSAPTEVHVMTTERCPAGCPSCYVDSTMESREPPTEQWRAILHRLADAGVFHVAMGGGEALLRADLFELAALARELRMVPNLTTSGIGMTREIAAKCRIFGQVNVSLDGTGEVYRASRGYDGADRALRALGWLAEAGVPCGINLVLHRGTWDSLDDTIAAAAAAGAHEVEILRFKPAGRAVDTYETWRLDASQRHQVLPRLMELMQKWPHLNIKVDCSLVPFLCAAGPDPRLLEMFGVVGCEAGNMLSAIRADLQMTSCSFIEERIGDAHVTLDEWQSPEVSRWHEYHHNAPQPCRSCEYRTICKGGCRAVSRHLTGNYFVPDPECPRVEAFNASRNQGETPECSS